MERIRRPTFLLDKKKCLKNIEMMAEKAKRNKVRFRPHFKTHQSGALSKWFRDFGAKAITVSSLQMAEYFAGFGWDDITVAFPVNILETRAINDLSDRVQLNLLVEDVQTVELLGGTLRNHVGVFVKIDVGYNRTGIPAEDITAIDQVVEEIDQHEKLVFKGMLTHAGHSYHAKCRDEILAIHQITMRKMEYLRKVYSPRFPKMELSVGDTPTCSLADDFKEVDEIRPGNFVFYDYQQLWLQSCSFEQIAVVLACPVVSVHRDRLIVHGGSAHLSKEYIMDAVDGHVYGLVVELTDCGWSFPIPGMKVTSLSQEHGIVAHPGRFKVGDVIGIVPVHSCLTANLMKVYHTLDGEYIENQQVERNAF